MIHVYRFLLKEVFVTPMIPHLGSEVKRCLERNLRFQKRQENIHPKVCMYIS